jgi:Holliday junction resolvase RusA-like endonuclease
MIELHLPYPPSKNQLRKRTRTGVARTDHYRDWLENAGKEIMVQRARKPRGVKGRYKLSIQAVRPAIVRKRDLGNLLEATEDLLTAMQVVEDDSLSEMITLRWVTTGSPFVVRVEPAGLE